MGGLVKIILGIILNYPGAYLRWLIFRRRRFKEYTEEISLNYFAAMVFIVALLVIYNLLFE